jgi:hypothetical protein
LELVVTLYAVTACAPVPNRAPHSVSYYRNHPAALHAMLARCTNDPGRLAHTSACINARAAARLGSVGSLAHLPPMGLASPHAGSPQP